jgi:quinol monooxygenase YgiN
MGRYGLVGKLTAHAGQREELLELLLEAAKGVADAPGCEMWIVSISPDDPDSVWVNEIWRSEEDHDASLTMEETRSVIARAMPLIAGMEGTKLTPLAGKGLADDGS